MSLGKVGVIFPALMNLERLGISEINELVNVQKFQTEKLSRLDQMKVVPLGAHSHLGQADQ